MSTNNFQREFVKQYDRILYESYKDLLLGEFVTLFPNPDYSATISDTSQGNYVTLNEALDDFQQITFTNFEYKGKGKFLGLLKEAFVEAFGDLSDFRGLRKGFPSIPES